MLELDIHRRLVLKATLGSAACLSLAVTGLLKPRDILAAWYKEAFSSKSVNEALKSGLGSSDLLVSDQVIIEAPKVAANGATVQVAVETRLPGVEVIALIAEKNPRPLCCIFRPGTGVSSKVKTRIKMGETGDVIAQVGRNVRRVGEELFEVVARRVVESEAGHPA